MKPLDFNALAIDIKSWAKELGFQNACITDINLNAYEKSFKEWVNKKFHG